MHVKTQLMLQFPDLEQRSVHLDDLSLTVGDDQTTERLMEKYTMVNTCNHCFYSKVFLGFFFFVVG